MRRGVLETVMGAAVLLVAGAFLFFSYSTANVGRIDGYPVLAEFDDVGTLEVGADVRIGGIRVGSVTDRRLDPKTFGAIVTFTVAEDVELPVDSTAKIASESLLGGSYLSVTPGAEDKTIPPGGRIVYVQSAVSLSDMIGRFIFSNENAAGR